ncbi:MAG: SPOR domain-containing protein [Candidatus Omnitrophica bacterium]|nr:SPOR domain-containing protein [Candidatus Omnitrophota bacterium]
MERENYSQLELFSGGSSVAFPKPCLSSRVVSFIRSYEKVILVTMGFLITGIIFFSLGVERGKRCVVVSNSASRMDMAIKKEVPRIQPVPVAAAKVAAVKAVAVQAFTIQIASYLKRDLAQKEALALNKKGISAAIFPKGNYFMLCAGNFSDRRSAEMLLARLKKQYRDCMIRKM